MTLHAGRDIAAGQPLSIETAQATLARYQAQWNEGKLEAFLDGFTDDIVVDFADVPPIEGKPALEAFIRARLSRQKGYTLQKTLRAVIGSTIIGSWVAQWTDAQTGRGMRGRGIEFITLRDGKCARWEAAFNTWPDDGPRASLFT